jgi:hypothetical protein
VILCDLLADDKTEAGPVLSLGHGVAGMPEFLKYGIELLRGDLHPLS